MAGSSPNWKTTLCKEEKLLIIFRKTYTTHTHKKKDLVCKRANTIIDIFHKSSVFLKDSGIFVAFVEVNATMSSIQYFENHASYFVQN